MHPYQPTYPGKWEMPIYKPYIMWVFMGKLSPRIPREPNKYQGHTVRGTPNCPLLESKVLPQSYPPINKALLRDYQPLVSLNKAGYQGRLFVGVLGGIGGVTLGSHDT